MLYFACGVRRSSSPAPSSRCTKRLLAASAICRRNDISPRSEIYLAELVDYDMSVDDLDLYQIMRAAGQVEGALGLGLTTKYSKPKPRLTA